jgi:hypothetical protein
MRVGWTRKGIEMNKGRGDEVKDIKRIREKKKVILPIVLTKIVGVTLT